MDILHNVDLQAKDGSERKGIATFKTKAFFRPQAATNWDSSITVLSPDGKSIFAFFGRDYLVEVVDLASDTAVKRFRRTCPRIPHVESNRETDFRKKYGFPKIEYETDIRGLYPIDGRAWVETSTEDKAKGRLVDVFDRGRPLHRQLLPGRRQGADGRQGRVHILPRKERGRDDRHREMPHWKLAG